MSTKVNQTIALDMIKDKTVGEMVRQVWEKGVTLVVEMSEQAEVVIQPKPRLRPLPELEGNVPNGWKDALCG
jgi:hypothetical protein